MKVWITKWALMEKIIREEDVEIVPGTGGNTVVVSGVDPRLRMAYVDKPHWHADRAVAVAHAEAMRQKSLTNYRRGLERMQSLKFE
jgi:hypothetical protein